MSPLLPKPGALAQSCGTIPRAPRLQDSMVVYCAQHANKLQSYVLYQRCAPNTYKSPQRADEAIMKSWSDKKQARKKRMCKRDDLLLICMDDLACVSFPSKDVTYISSM